MQSVLVAEPEPDTREYLERNLRDDGFTVVGTGRDGEALDLAERAKPHVVLAAQLDLCSRIREGEPGRRWDRDVPVIVLAPEQADPVLRVRAFERGADDVVVRPIVYLELRARIRALLRRTGPGIDEVLEAGDIVVDRTTRVVRVRDMPIRLPGGDARFQAPASVHQGRAATRRLGVQVGRA